MMIARIVFFCLTSFIASFSYGQFENTYTLPTDALPPSIGSNSMVTILKGGQLTDEYEINAPLGTDLNNVEVNIQGGRIGDEVKIATHGSPQNVAITISDGEIGDGFQVGSLSRQLDRPTVSIRGGTVGQGFYATSSSIYLSAGVAEEIELTRASLSIFDAGIAEEVEADQSGVTLFDGGRVHSFNLVNDSSLRILGPNAIVGDLNVNASSRAELADGDIDSIDVRDEGSIAVARGTANIHFASVGEEGSLTIRGGEFLGPLHAAEESTVRIYGRDFRVGGIDPFEMVEPGPGNPRVVIDQRNVELTGFHVLPFEFQLNPTAHHTQDFFSPNATLELVLIDGIDGDFDGDDDVDSADRLIQTQRWTGASDPILPPFAPGDVDGDGDVDTADVNRTITSWTGAIRGPGSGQAQADQLNALVVPETNQSLFSIALLASFFLCRRRSLHSKR